MEPDPLVVGLALTALITCVILGIRAIDRYVDGLYEAEIASWQKFAAEEERRLANRGY